jgi:hypothetical protein
MNWMASLFFQKILNLVKILNFLLNHYKWSSIKCVPFVGQTLLWFFNTWTIPSFFSRIYDFFHNCLVCVFILHKVMMILTLCIFFTWLICSLSQTFNKVFLIIGEVF